jgi:hypothetical protein
MRRKTLSENAASMVRGVGLARLSTILKAHILQRDPRRVGTNPFDLP